MLWLGEYQMKIRSENSKDHSDVENVTREAFWNVYRPGCVEHLVVHNFRSSPAFVRDLSLVVEAEDSKDIIAHILYCKTTIQLDSGGHKDLLMLGPISVLPKYQHKGIGSALIEHSMQKAKELSYGAVALTGNPEFYHRFGFRSGSEFTIFYPGMGRTEDASFFMVAELSKGYLANAAGTIVEPQAYSVSDEAVQEFDAMCPPKVKEIRPGQLG